MYFVAKFSCRPVGDWTIEFVWFLQGKSYNCFTYLAQPSHIVDHLQPYHWYKKLVLLGARYYQFPHSYLAAIESVKSIDDPDESRRKQHDVLIKKILRFCDDPLIL